MLRDAQRDYAQWMAAQPIGGVAIWAHTGRGLLLSAAQRADVLEDWRRAVGEGVLVIAGCGVAAEGGPLPTAPAARTEAVIERTRDMALQAASGGADAILVHPPGALAGLPDHPARVVAMHEAVGELGLPLIAFLLYARASGLEYDHELVRALLRLPSVVGIKVATLDSVMRFQDVAAAMRRDHPDRLLITGEDRFLGYSLQLGAHAALVGMGAACTGVQAELVRAACTDDAERFLTLARACDQFGAATFVAPMEGYVRRMLWALHAGGVMPEEACHDPFGPPLDADDRARVIKAVRAMQSVA